MKGPELLQLLLDKKKLSGNALAKALKGSVSQSSIQKFLVGTAREPRRHTLQAFATYFDVPVEAFYDEFLAGKVAFQMGLTPLPEGPLPPYTTEAHEPRAAAAAPIPFPATTGPTLRDSFRRIRVALSGQTPGVRRSVVALLGDLADKAEDAEFSEHTVDRIMAVLGEGGGKPAAPESTFSAQGGSK